MKANGPGPAVVVPLERMKPLCIAEKLLPETNMEQSVVRASSRFSYRSRLKFLGLGFLMLLFPPLPVRIWGDPDPDRDARSDLQAKGLLEEDGTDKQKISFVHVSDIHARYNPDRDGTFPLARIRGFYRQVKEENPFTLLTNAGDDYEKGSVAEELSRGRATREVAAAMRYDVRTLGNHDFAWGIDELLRFSRDPSAAVVVSNADLDPSAGQCAGGTAPAWTDFSIITLGRVRIGFFGLVSRPWDERNMPYDGPYYPEVKGLRTDFDFIGRARTVIARHRHQVDLLVLVSHLGIEDDSSLAAGTRGIDLILGGHSHTVMEEPLRVNGTTIIHAGAFAETMGRYDIDYDVRSKAIVGSSFQLVVNRGGDIPEDQETSEKIAEILDKYQPTMSESLVHVGQDQDSRAMALIAAQAVVAGMKIDAALISQDSVGDLWPSGWLTRQDILNGFRVERQPAGTPGQTSLYLLNVRGADLLHAAAAAADLVYYGPKAINPGLLYTVAMQKTQALHQQDSFGRSIGLSTPRPAGEVWETVVAYAQRCRAAGLSLDDGSINRRHDTMVALVQNDSHRLTAVP